MASIFTAAFRFPLDPWFRLVAMQFYAKNINP